MVLNYSRGASRMIWWNNEGQKYSGNEILDLLSSQIREVVDDFIGLDSITKFTLEILPYYSVEGQTYDRKTYPQSFANRLEKVGPENLRSYCGLLDKETQYFNLFREKRFRDIGIYGDPYGLVGTNLLMFIGMLNELQVSPEEFASTLRKMNQVVSTRTINAYLSKAFFFQPPEELSGHIKNFGKFSEATVDSYKKLAESLGIGIASFPIPKPWFERSRQIMAEIESFDSASDIHEYIKEVDRQNKEKYGTTAIDAIKSNLPLEYLLLILSKESFSSDKLEPFSKQPLFHLHPSVTPPYTFLSPAGRSVFTLFESSLDSVERYSKLRDISEVDYVEDDEAGKSLLGKLEAEGYCIKEKSEYPKVGGFSMVKAILFPRSKLERMTRTVTTDDDVKKVYPSLYLDLLDSFKSSGSFSWIYPVDHNNPALKRHLRKIRAINPPLHEKNELWEYKLIDTLLQPVSLWGMVLNSQVKEFYTDFSQNVDGRHLCQSSFDRNNSLFADANITSDGLSYRLWTLENDYDLFGLKIVENIWKNFRVTESHELTPEDILFLSKQLERNTMQAILAEKIISKKSDFS